MDDPVNEVLRQIEQLGYDAELKLLGIKDIVKTRIAFKCKIVKLGTV